MVEYDMGSRHLACTAEISLYYLGHQEEQLNDIKMRALFILDQLVKVLSNNIIVTLRRENVL
jgi:hypothetical protein